MAAEAKSFAGPLLPPPGGVAPSMVNYASGYPIPNYPYGYGPSYVSQTPFGGLGGLSGDLLYPLVLVGVFILGVLLVLTFLKMLAGGVVNKVVKRDTTSAKADEGELDRLTTIVMAAISSEECMDRILCESGLLLKSNKGPFANGADALFSSLASLVPSSKVKVQIIRDATGSCTKYACANIDNKTSS